MKPKNDKVELENVKILVCFVAPPSHKGWLEYQETDILCFYMKCFATYVHAPICTSVFFRVTGGSGDSPICHWTFMSPPEK